MSTRSRKQEVRYKRYLQKSDPKVCAFCNIDQSSEQYVTETKYFKVIKNIFSYSIWDGQEVEDHLMVTPKVHTDSLVGMSASQKVEWVDLLEKYERQGYNVYARAPASKIKSVIHQHTHFIKTRGAPKKFTLVLRKPYIRVTR